MSEEYDKNLMKCLFTKEDWEIWENIQAGRTDKYKYAHPPKSLKKRIVGTLKDQFSWLYSNLEPEVEIEYVCSVCSGKEGGEYIYYTTPSGTEYKKDLNVWDVRIIPKNRGGTDEDDNCVTLCSNCYGKVCRYANEKVANIKKYYMSYGLSQLKQGNQGILNDTKQ